MLALVFTLSGVSCSRDDVIDEFGKMFDPPKTSSKKQDTSRVKEGKVFYGIESVSSETADGDEGEWEWIWVCQENNYDSNWIRYSVAHYGGLDVKAPTAGEIFNNYRKLYLAEMEKTYTGQSTDREYYYIVWEMDQENVVGYLRYYPNQGEKKADGTFWGVGEGAYTCFRGPKCVISATTHIKRPRSLEEASGINGQTMYIYFSTNIIFNLRFDIEILDNE